MRGEGEGEGEGAGAGAGEGGSRAAHLGGGDEAHDAQPVRGGVRGRGEVRGGVQRRVGSQARRLAGSQARRLAGLRMVGRKERCEASEASEGSGHTKGVASERRCDDPQAQRPSPPPPARWHSAAHTPPPPRPNQAGRLGGLTPRLAAPRLRAVRGSCAWQLCVGVARTRRDGERDRTAIGQAARGRLRIGQAAKDRLGVG